MANAFHDTLNLFRTYTSYTGPLSFESWKDIPDNSKAAVLFVQFYEQITLAWYKTKSFFVLEEDGVSTVLQYLNKNVPIILNQPKRFTPSYIYRVAYNCLYCISHDIKRDIERWEKETSNIISYGEDELDLFDTVVCNYDIDAHVASDQFWEIIEDMGIETAKVVNHLLNGESLGKARKNSKSYTNDPLAEISVSADKMAQIIEELKDKLSDFRTIYGV